MQIKALVRIAPYVGPQWLVVPQGAYQGACDRWERQAVQEEGFEIAERCVVGWANANAIIRSNISQNYYLAHLEEV